jgi:signal transduction histidine kinase
MTERDLSVPEQELLRRVGGSVQVLVHDIRNHLTKVLGQAQMMAWKLSMVPGVPPEAVAEAEDRSNRIVEAVRVCDQLLGHYQHTYRRAPVSPGPVPLTDIVQAALRALPPEAADRVESGIDEALWVSADPQQMPIALRACLENALRASLPDGAVQLRAVAEGDEVCITVEDRGIGMTEEQIAEAFLPFHSAWPDGGGPGIGLFAAERVVSGGGGRILLESPGAGCGTVVRIAVPIVAVP